MAKNQKEIPNRLYSFLIGFASFVIIIAGLKASQSLVVPFLLSIFIAIICSPLLFWLRRKGIPTAISILLVIFVIISAGSIIGTLVGTSLNDFSESIPFYQERLLEKTTVIFGILEKIGFNLSGQMVQDYIDPGAAMQMTSIILTGLGNVLSNTFLIILTVVFMLVETSNFEQKLHAAIGPTERTMGRLKKFAETINRYMVIKTWISLGTGCAVALWLTILGVDYPLLWGILAFLFNYVPNIGSIISAIPAVLLAFIQLGSFSAVLTGTGYLVLNVIIGNLLEPRFMGKGLGLSSLIVFLSLVFWGWVLGPVGMLLSIPLTMTLKIAFASSGRTKWISVLLDAGPPAEK